MRLRPSLAPEGDRHVSDILMAHRDWVLRFSVAAKGDRHLAAAAAAASGSVPTRMLRFSVAPEDDRPERVVHLAQRPGGVAILGRPGGRPPQERGGLVKAGVVELRSLAAPESDRHILATLDEATCPEEVFP
ncbi:hypothetical protein ACWF2L_30765 [Streptomyces anulatus]